MEGIWIKKKASPYSGLQRQDEPHWSSHPEGCFALPSGLQGTLFTGLEAHVIHVHPSSRACPHGRGHMPHLTPTYLMRAQNSTQDQIPTCRGICIQLSPYPQSRKLVVDPAHQIFRCIWLVHPETTHTTFFLKVWINCKHLKIVVFYFQNSSSTSTIRPNSHVAVIAHAELF